MLGQNVKCAIEVEDEVETTKQRLVCTYLRETAAGEAVKCECRDANGIKFPRPHLDVSAHATRAMLEHDDRQSAGAACDPQLSGGDRRFAVCVTGLELRVGQRERI